MQNDIIRKIKNVSTKKNKQYAKSKKGKIAAKRYYQKNAERVREVHLEKEYGITVEEYETMYRCQGGVCAICHNPEIRQYAGRTASLSVDHDRKTDKVRGLLCQSCNVGIGSLKHNPDRLRAAANYLEKHNDRNDI